MAFVARVGNLVASRIFGNGHRHRVIANPCLDAQHRARHVALHAGTPRALFRMMRMRADGFADRRVALRADGRVRPGAVAGSSRWRCRARPHGTYARHAAFQKALALPEPESVGRKTPRAPVRPVSGIFIHWLIVFENRHEVVVIVVARCESGNEDVAEGMALRANHRVARRFEPRLKNDVSCRARGPGLVRARQRCVVLYVLDPGPWQRSQFTPKSSQAFLYSDLLESNSSLAG